MEKKFSKISERIREEIDKKTFPGAVLGIVNKEGVIYKKAFGFAQIDPEKRKMTTDTIFDLASLTKVVATTSAVLHLIAEGRLNLWDYLGEFFPSLPEEKEDLTIYHLLTHCSGYQATEKMWGINKDYTEKIEHILKLPLKNKIGSQIEYSDLNFILLGELVQRVSNKSLDQYLKENIFIPLGMYNTTFNPKAKLGELEQKDFAVTEYCNWRKRYIWGEVHDENSYSLGGISGHAGLFSTIDDLIIFTRMLLNKGKIKNENILPGRLIAIMKKNWTNQLEQNRALGWDLANNYRSSSGILMGADALGHTGFTGTSLWLSTTQDLGVILLTNRVHPTRENTGIIEFRPRIHNLIVSVMDSNGLLKEA